MNYGTLPQTRVSPAVELNGCRGDNCPLNAFELNDEPCKKDSVHAVRVVGVVGHMSIFQAPGPKSTFTSMLCLCMYILPLALAANWR